MKTVPDHKTRSHAILAPSGASIWMACPPSARLQDSLPEVNTIYSEEGTLAHEINDLTLHLALGNITKVKYKKDLAKLKLKKSSEGEDLYSEEMLDCAAEYESIVLQQLTEARQISKDAIIYIERKFDLSQYIPESKGHLDASIIADKWLFITDYKHGKGVPVSSVQNKQMLIYALGAYLEFRDIYDIENIRMTIVQPRIDNNSSWEISVTDLMKWVEDELKPAADLAWKGEGEFNPGVHCQFCKAKPTCKANFDKQMQLAAMAFDDQEAELDGITINPALITDKDVAFILEREKIFIDWLGSVKAHALNEAVNNNKQWPGFKLVEGRSNRKYTDPDKILEVLESAGYKKYDVGEYKIFGITAMEKEITKKKFAELLSPLVVKPAGKPVLVPEDDKREALNTAEAAANAFKDEPE